MPVGVGLLLLPMVEIAGFVVIGPYLGVAGTLGVVLLSALLGSALLRAEGLGTLLRVRQSVAAGDTPLPAATEGALRILAALLLIIPGFISTAIGLILLFPPARMLVQRHLLNRMGVSGKTNWVARFGSDTPPDGRVIDAEFHEVHRPGAGLPPGD